MMTVGKLYESLQQMLESGSVESTTPVEILVSDTTIGSSAAIEMAGIYCGFDWDQGRCLISPIVPLRKMNGGGKVPWIEILSLWMYPVPDVIRHAVQTHITAYGTAAIAAGQVL